MVPGCIYKHSKQQVPGFLDNYILPLLETLSQKNEQILIMGDFNINLLNFNDKILQKLFSWSNIFLFLYNFFNTPTRVTGRSRTLIDSIFYNKPRINIMLET